jgi:hypothetical protein
MTGDLAGVTWHGDLVGAPQPVDPDRLVVVDVEASTGPAEPRTVLTMKVTREPRYPDYTDLGGPDKPGEDYYLLVDGKQIGGTYWCSAADIPDGQRWASYGPAGYSLRNPDRETAEQVQIREYAINPDLTDRQIADEQREADARRAQLDAEEEAEAEVRRRKREGDDEPGEPVWVLPPYHFLTAHPGDVAAVKAWLDAHDLDSVSGAHEIRVERRATRQALVVHEVPIAAFSSRTQLRAVTCRQAPPEVDTTPHPDLVALIEQGHAPAKFPLIDFGQNWACSACTKKHGSPTEIVCWPCPVFEETRAAGAHEEATRSVVAAEAAVRVAAAIGRDATPEENRLRTAEIHYVRTWIALSAARRDPAEQADVRFVMVTSSDDDGSTWTPVHWVGFARLPGETADGQALRYAGHHHLTPEDPRWIEEDPKPYRVEIYSDPRAADPDGVWTNLTDPCPPGRHIIGVHPIAGGPARTDGSRVEDGCCARCFHRVWRIVPADKPASRWKLAGSPLPGPSPSASRRDSDSDPRPDSDPAPVATITGEQKDPGPSPSAPASFGFRVETRTGRRWCSVRMGNTPPLFRPDPDGLWAAADTIMGNIRQVLGLGVKDPMPGVRVRAWHLPSGATHLLSRPASRKGNSGAF